MSTVTLENYTPPASAIAFESVLLEASVTLDGPWEAIDTVAIPVDATPNDPDVIDVITTLNFPYEKGWIRVTFLTGSGTPTLPSEPIYITSTIHGGIAGMVPRFRRALEGFGSSTLTDADVRAIIADAGSEVIFYAPDWGKQIVVTARDGDTAAPTEFAFEPELTLPEGTLVAAQAALSWFMRKASELKTMERIADEGSSWEYQVSASAIAAKLKQLAADRDRALEIAVKVAPPLDVFASFLATRDWPSAVVVEPWGEETVGWGGQERDWRFG